MITIEIQSLIIGMICAYAVSCVVKVWKEKYEHARETKTDTKKAKSNDEKIAEQQIRVFGLFSFRDIFKLYYENNIQTKLS